MILCFFQGNFCCFCTPTAEFILENPFVGLGIEGSHGDGSGDPPKDPLKALTKGHSMDYENPAEYVRRFLIDFFRWRDRPDFSSNRHFDSIQKRLGVPPQQAEPSLSELLEELREFSRNHRDAGLTPSNNNSPSVNWLIEYLRNFTTIQKISVLKKHVDPGNLQLPTMGDVFRELETFFSSPEFQRNFKHFLR